jgi:hypothetical protein
MNKEQALKELESAGWVSRNAEGEPEVCFSSGDPDGWVSVDSNLTRKHLQALLVFLPEGVNPTYLSSKP